MGFEPKPFDFDKDVLLFHCPSLLTCTLNLIIVVWAATGARFSPITSLVKDVVFRSYL